MKDLYEILSVEEDANARTLKKAYRLKAKAFHPDVNPEEGAEEKFQNILQAYLILSDPKKRAIYDQGFEIPEVNVPDRPKYPPPQAFGKWQPFYNRPMGHESNSKSVKIDYNQYQFLSKMVGLITFLFALTFLADFLLYTEHKQLPITSLQSKVKLTKKVDDLGIVIVKAGDHTFEKRRELQNEMQLGEVIDLRKSLIYGYVKYKRGFSERFVRSTILATIVRFAALLVYVASLTAIFTKKSPEVKFNAALISAFFSVALLAFVLLT